MWVFQPPRDHILIPQLCSLPPSPRAADPKRGTPQRQRSLQRALDRAQRPAGWTGQDYREPCAQPGEAAALPSPSREVWAWHQTLLSRQGSWAHPAGPEAMLRLPPLWVPWGPQRGVDGGRRLKPGLGLLPSGSVLSRLTQEPATRRSRTSKQQGGCTASQWNHFIPQPWLPGAVRRLSSPAESKSKALATATADPGPQHSPLSQLRSRAWLTVPHARLAPTPGPLHWPLPLPRRLFPRHPQNSFTHCQELAGMPPSQGRLPHQPVGTFARAPPPAPLMLPSRLSASSAPSTIRQTPQFV